MPRPRKIGVDEDFPIHPSDIDASSHLADAFDNMETEVSAGYIIRMMQLRGNWGPFSESEINEFYQTKPKPTRFRFNHLIGEFWVTRGGPGNGYDDSLDVIVKEGDLYYITDQFVLRAYGSRPIPRKK